MSYLLPPWHPEKRGDFKIVHATYLPNQDFFPVLKFGLDLKDEPCTSKSSKIWQLPYTKVRRNPNFAKF